MPIATSQGCFYWRVIQNNDASCGYRAPAPRGRNAPRRHAATLSRHQAAAELSRDTGISGEYASARPYAVQEPGAPPQLPQRDADGVADDVAGPGTQRRKPGYQGGWGYSKLSDFVAATGLFRAKTRSPGEGKPGIIYVKDKRRQPPSAKAS
jgi:hypothetical protein